MGVGTWAAFGAGKVMVGIDSSDTAFDTVEETGGSKTDSHTLTTSEIPSHTHDVPNIPDPGGNSGGSNQYAGQDWTVSNVNNVWTNNGQISPTYFDTRSTGGGGAHTHDIVQPYIVVYMWKRTA